MRQFPLKYIFNVQPTGDFRPSDPC